MMRQPKISEELQQLEGLARISRSVVPFEKSLEEKCMECIFKNAPLLHAHSATRDQFARIPPLVRRDFLKKLGTFPEEPVVVVTQRDFWAYLFEDRHQKRIFKMVQLLVDETVTEFDFGVYGEGFEKDEETRRLLLERCPDLKRINENERRWDVLFCIIISDVLPSLLQLRNLEHIQLKTFWCWEEGELAQLVEAFPNLRSLAVRFKHQHIEGFTGSLLELQKLEYLWLKPGWEQTADQALSLIATQNGMKKVMAKCLLQLPFLQEASPTINIQDKVSIFPKVIPCTVCI